MQPVNNDMDNLMRKAAEAYAVQPTGADWEKVMAHLDGNEPKTAAVNTGAMSRRYLLLLVFLLTSLVCNKYLFLKVGSNRNNNLSELKQSTIAQKKEEKKGVVTGIKKETVPKPVSIPYTEPYRKNVSKSFYQKTKQSNRFIGFEKDTDNTNSQLERRPTFHSQRNKQPLHLDFTKPKTFEIPFVNADPTILTPEPIVTKNANEKVNKKWYAGIVGGPDVSTIKFEKVKAAGYSIGVVTGYKLNSKWALETGLLWDRKHYYANGKDFNTSKIALPSHASIIYAEGYCDMFEIPFNVRYNFKSGERHNWFAAAGASSYLMQKEEYDYLYERYNVQYYSNKCYTASSKNWLAVANISAGYEYKWSQGGTIRLEPYVKLPLQGAGIGKLPITSAGIQVGVTHTIR